MSAGALSGQTVVVTRARAQAPELVEALEARGASVLEVPSISIVPMQDLEPLDRALDDPSRWDLIAFGSRNAAAVVLERAAALGRSLAAVPLAAVGEKTAEHLRSVGLPAAVVPATFHAGALAGAVLSHFGGSVQGRRILVPRAPEGREVLMDDLRSAGAEVHSVAVYRLSCAPAVSWEVQQAVETATALTFLSGKTLECFLEVLPEAVARRALDRAVVAVIGPVAERAAARLGVRVDVVPSQATVQALVEALAAHFEARESLPGDSRSR